MPHMPELSLCWHRDLDGYRIESGSTLLRERASGGYTEAHLLAASPTRVVRKGGELERFDPLKWDGLCRALARTPQTPEGARTFASRYGLLRSGDSEAVDDIYNEIEVANWLIEREQDRELLARWLTENAKTMRLTPTMTKDGLFFQPVSLQSAIYLQFFADLENGAQLKLCARPGCETWFKYGPGTGKRNTAQYCTRRCEKAHSYERSKEKAQ